MSMVTLGSLVEYLTPKGLLTEDMSVRVYAPSFMRIGDKTERAKLDALGCSPIRVGKFIKEFPSLAGGFEWFYTPEVEGVGIAGGHRPAEICRGNLYFPGGFMREFILEIVLEKGVDSEFDDGWRIYQERKAA